MWPLQSMYFIGKSWHQQTNTSSVFNILLINRDKYIYTRNSQSMHYGKVSMGGATFRILNFASHFICVQIFQIDFPLIISASKYFRQISLSFYICRGQNEQPAISQIYLLGDEMNSCLKEGMESESEIINQIFGHHAA